jgi:TPR repeat protein
MLGVAAAQESTNNLPGATKSVATNTVEETKAGAEKEDAKAQLSLAVSYYSASNYTEAAKWFQKSAEQSNAPAQLLLGSCYENGEGVIKNMVEAAKWYRKAAEQGIVQAQVCLGNTYYNGRGIPKDFVEAARWYRKAAEQGHAGAQLLLAFCYENGTGVPKDEDEAANWSHKAAENPDQSSIVEAFRLNAEQGSVEAQDTLGLYYYFGWGVPKDYREAFKWWEKAAKRGNVDAQYYLGTCYGNGEGVKKDSVEAVMWFGKAAKQSDARAQYSLGVAYCDGIGVGKNVVEGVNWKLKAAKQGSADAQYGVGAAFFNGQGVAKNYVQAYIWMSLALAQGNAGAAQYMPVIEQKSTPEQIAEAQELAREFKPHKESGSDNSTSPSNPTASGTGFFITDDGYLITNNHVVKDATQVRLVTSAGLIVAKVIKVDAANDLALLKVEGRFTPLPIAASRTVVLGGTVATVGFPNIGLQGFAPKLAKGEIASLSGAGDDPRYFQISVPVQPGNSGGALVDERGNVIGIVSAKLNASAALAASGALPENVNYAVKSSFLLSFLESVPVVSAKLKAPVTADRKFEDVVKSAQNAAVLVLVY